MKLSTFVSITTPSSLRGNAKLCKLYGGKNHPVKLHLTGLPISDLCSLNPETEKENTIVSIARWDAFVQKRPFMLMGICELAGQLPPGWKFEIFGRIPEAMTRWHAKLPLDIQSRVVIHGLQPGEIISHALQRAKIYLCTSSFETGPQTIYEALACGVSVVGLDSQNIAASKHAEIQGHAVLCKEDSPQSFMNSLKESISLWEAAAYKPRQIAEFWAANNHVSNLSRKIISILDLKN
jgi:glycosyltransferase involved in cell wall biosynthesis